MTELLSGSTKVEISEAGLDDGLEISVRMSDTTVLRKGIVYVPAVPKRLSRTGNPIWVRLKEQEK